MCVHIHHLSVCASAQNFLDCKYGVSYRRPIPNVPSSPPIGRRQLDSVAGLNNPRPMKSECVVQDDQSRREEWRDDQWRVGMGGTRRKRCVRVDCEPVSVSPCMWPSRRSAAAVFCV
ncbi:hypothetical protein AOLI_G00247120 [Acnodon oligacanthus]